VRNVRTTPDVRARWNGRWYYVKAVELAGADHAAAWAQAVGANPGYADYATDLTRPIPIIRLEHR
jgi:hypothetical protein